MDNQQWGNVDERGAGFLAEQSQSMTPGVVGQPAMSAGEQISSGWENLNSLGEAQKSQRSNWGNQEILGQVALTMPQTGQTSSMTGELGIIVNENDREREELTGEKVVGTDRPKIQDREGLSAERMNYIEKGIRERRNDLHALKRFATDEMIAELKGRYGRIFGSEN